MWQLKQAGKSVPSIFKPLKEMLSIFYSTILELLENWLLVDRKIELLQIGLLPGAQNNDTPILPCFCSLTKVIHCADNTGTAGTQHNWRLQHNKVLYSSFNAKLTLLDTVLTILSKTTLLTSSWCSWAGEKIAKP